MTKEAGIMLDVKLLRTDLAAVEAMLQARRSDLDLSAFTNLDHKRRQLITDSDKLKHERKEASKQIGQMIKRGMHPEEAKAEVHRIGDQIKAMDAELAATEAELNAIMASIPNMLDASTPIGGSEADNTEVSHFGQPPQFDFPVEDHVDLGVGLGILDFESAAKITGARFAMLRGDGARLERALIQFMTDIHREQGYFEVMPPFMVNGDSMFGTGQFPKMKEDVFKIDGFPYYLVPTAEVPVTNIHRDEILKLEQLPITYQAFTPCFRSEAGAYGRDTRGLIRQHQFNKVELVKFTHPDRSAAELEELRDDAEEVLRRLELPYRVVTLCSADISFAASKCYDIEVWLPGQDTFREISSCSNFKDFQARRANIRFKEEGKTHFVHTLNGSGLAVGRTLVAILENGQLADGRVRLPKALQPYMDNQEIIEKQRL